MASLETSGPQLGPGDHAGPPPFITDYVYDAPFPVLIQELIYFRNQPVEHS
jgi:hypothetical protein